MDLKCHILKHRALVIKYPEYMYTEKNSFQLPKPHSGYNNHSRHELTNNTEVCECHLANSKHNS